MSPAGEPKIGIVILNWKNPADTLRCLEALSASSYSNYQVVVVENGSGDDSPAILGRILPATDLIISQKNLGYTGGNNIGIRKILERDVDYVFLLNDDAVVDRDTLATLAQATKDYPQAGFLGPKILSLEESEVLLSTGGFFGANRLPVHRGMGQRDQGQYDQATSVDFISGCALLVKRQAIEEIGLLDEDYFAYHEEIDWCYRARLAGVEIIFIPGARVWHPDTRNRDSDSPTVTYYTTRNSLLFARKHRLGWGLILARLIEYYRRLLSWTLRPKWRHKRPQRQALARALSDFWHGRTGSAFIA